jgi:hypothetical protein
MIEQLLQAELDADRAIVISQKCVLVPYDTYSNLKSFRTRAEAKLTQLEAEAEGATPPDFGVRDAERDAMIKTLRWLLGRGI